MSNLLKGTTSDFLDAMGRIKNAGMEQEFQAITAYFDSLKQLISSNKEEVKDTQKNNDELQSLAQSIINLTKLEHQALKDRPKHNGKKGGSHILHQAFYDLVDRILEKEKGDLGERGTKARIVRMVELKAGNTIEAPSRGQVEKIVSKKIDLLINHPK
jgi:hypothetical protein